MVPNENKDEASQKKIETKYKDPNRLDKAPYGQIWKVIGEKDQSTIWVQTSKIDGDPNWVNITALFDTEIQSLLRDTDFQNLIQTI